MKFNFFSLLLLVSILSQGQTDTIYVSNQSEKLYLIYDTTKNNAHVKIFEESYHVWANPSIMSDRWLLDSNGHLMSSMVNNEFGHTYYRWHANGIIHSEELKIRPYNFHREQYLDESGRMLYQDSESPYSYITVYHDSIQSIKSIYIELPLDSFNNAIASNFIPSSYLDESSRCYVVFNFNQRGYLISTGHAAKALNNSDKRYQNFDIWVFYTEKGEFIETKTFKIE
ncbi:MAG: hypothetical protein ACYC1Q_11275 [Bacteroidia bacterium]